MRSDILELPGQDSLYPKSSQEEAETTHQRTFAHALPTSHAEDPDLALIVGLWDRLADECKRRLVEIVRASVTTQVTNYEFDDINERNE